MLTKKQIEILKLRSNGYSQADIAKKLGTSRANISAIEKSAWENVKRARTMRGIATAIARKVTLARKRLLQFPPERKRKI